MYAVKIVNIKSEIQKLLTTLLKMKIEDINIASAKIFASCLWSLETLDDPSVSRKKTCKFSFSKNKGCGHIHIPSVQASVVGSTLNYIEK